MAIRLVVGLGNPGPKYHSTRHNIGRRVVDRLKKSGSTDSLLVTLEEYMNQSGVPVAKLAARESLGPEEILVVCDDFSLPLGTLRLRSKGSSGGHNGLASVIEHLGTESVPRLRIGIGPVPEGDDPADFVLEPFAAVERVSVDEMIEKAAGAVQAAIQEGLEPAMNRYNQHFPSAGETPTP